MVCLRDAHTHTGLIGPFTNGKRSGLVEGIEVIEFDLLTPTTPAYWSGPGILRYSLNSLQLALRSDADLVFATTRRSPLGSPDFRPLAEGTPFVFEGDLWPELPRAMGVVRNPLVLAALSGLE